MIIKPKPLPKNKNEIAGNTKQINNIDEIEIPMSSDLIGYETPINTADLIY